MKQSLPSMLDRPAVDTPEDVRPGRATGEFLAIRSSAPTLTRPGIAEGSWGIEDIVEEWGLQSFPASDPPSNW